jgi:hypothetical protein
MVDSDHARRWSKTSALFLIGGIVLAACAMSTGVILLGQQPGPDVKGWHGAEWGMSVEQVREASSLTLSGPRVPPIPGVTCHDSRQVEVGEWKPDVSFCFGGQGFKETELTGISLAFREHTKSSTTYAKLRDELKSKYGAPTSEKQDAMKYGTGGSTTRWLLPSTELECIANVIGNEQFIYVTYSRRKPSPF